MALIAKHLPGGAPALTLMRRSGGSGPDWYYLTRDRAVLLPPGSPLLAGLPYFGADALLLDLARDHAWACHQYRNRPDTTNDPRRPSSPPPGARSPEAL
ncbi:hypothetical protein [Streptomyces sp. S1]|uniref:hypothetical protein n=1 Tax=Streptomyces sp. S1 TaxID=718288 RepID=UPI003D75B90D